MVIRIDRSKCIYCSACVGVCPVLALRLNNGKIEWNVEKCIYCGNCEKICPAGAIKMNKNQKYE